MCYIFIIFPLFRPHQLIDRHYTSQHPLYGVRKARTPPFHQSAWSMALIYGATLRGRCRWRRCAVLLRFHAARSPRRVFLCTWQLHLDALRAVWSPIPGSCLPFASHDPRITRQTRHVDPMLSWCWSSVCDAGPTLAQHWVNVSRLPGRDRSTCYSYNNTLSIPGPPRPSGS